MSAKYANYTPLKPKHSEVSTEWKPHWKCYCCRDTGTVSPSHVFDTEAKWFKSQFPTGYPYAIACNARHCTAKYDQYGDIGIKGMDSRIDSETCDYIHRSVKAEWDAILADREQQAALQTQATEAVADFAEGF